MSLYKDLMVDVANPRTVFDHTAFAIMSVLQYGQWTPVQDVDWAIATHPNAQLQYKGFAMKGLRNTGYSIICTRGPMAEYKWEPAPTEAEGYQEKLFRMAYSHIISTRRALDRLVVSHPNNPHLTATLAGLESTAIQVGRSLGMSLQDIIADFQPL